MYHQLFSASVVICLVSVAQKLNNEASVRTRACAKTSAQESSTESYFSCRVAHLTCVRKHCFVGRVSRQKLPVTGACGGATNARGFSLRIWEQPLFPSPPNFVSWFLLSLSGSVVFVCVSRLKGFAVLYIASCLALAIFPKWLVTFLVFFSSVLFSFTFVSTLFCLTPVKKKKVVSLSSASKLCLKGICVCTWRKCALQLLPCFLLFRHF